MKNNKKVIILFTCVIVIIYLYGIIHSEYYDYRKDKNNPIYLSKTEFMDQTYPERDITNRAIDFDESKTHTYIYDFDMSLFSCELADVDIVKDNYHIMLEKPDCQYFEVHLNGFLIGKRGQVNGKANLWNNTYYIEFNKSMLLENNQLSITMYSDYMTGIAGDILILDEKDFAALELITNFSADITKNVGAMALFSAIVLIIIIRAWRNDLYNVHMYMCFLVTFIAISFSLLDYRDMQHIIIDYLLFKKIIFLSYHVAITFTTLAIALLLNAKFRFNFGMVGILFMLYAIMVSDNMIEFKTWYTYLHVFLIINILHLSVLLLMYRKRTGTSATVMLIGCLLCGVSIIKVILVTTRTIDGSLLIDLPLLIMIFVIIVLFIFFLELRKMANDHDVLAVDETNDYDVNSYMQGWFTIDNHLNVVGEFSISCNHIFGKRILGDDFITLIEAGAESKFLTDALNMIFDESYEYKEGFIALLPEELAINNRHYRFDYAVIERTHLLLYVMLSDITHNKRLEKSLMTQKNDYELIINALKSRQEVGFFIEKTKDFIKRLKEQGFTQSNRAELHTLKGNLGQLGFYQFEASIHLVENCIESDDCDVEVIADKMTQSLTSSLKMLYKHVREDYFELGYNQFTIKSDDVLRLEKMFLDENISEKVFLNELKALKNVSFKSMFYRYIDYVERISGDLEKAVFPLTIKGDDFKVFPEKAEKLVAVMVAIFRNSIIHGIETPEERLEVGKDSYGVLSCTVLRDQDHVVIKIKDDGRGICTETVLNKAIENNIIKAEEQLQLTHNDVVKLIFKADMSSKETVDIYAGRGFGLAAVSDVVTELGGTIEVETNKHKGTEFIIRLPILNLME